MSGECFSAGKCFFSLTVNHIYILYVYARGIIAAHFYINSRLYAALASYFGEMAAHYNMNATNGNI